MDEPVMTSPVRSAGPKIASHRGGADLWPENSMTAFRETAALDVDQVEFDVHPTRDGELVVHHDPTLERMTNGTGPISEQSLASLSQLIIKGTPSDRIPLLRDIFDLYEPTPIDLRLEIKADAHRFRYPGLERAIAEMLIAHDLQHRTTVTSFWIDTLLSFNACLADVPLIWLVDRSIVRQIGDLDSVLRIAAQRGIREIALHEIDLDVEQLRLGQAHGLAVGAYAVNDAASIRRMFELDVTVFTTNRPDLALAERGR